MNRSHLSRIALASLVVVAAAGTTAFVVRRNQVPGAENGRTLLHNGWYLTPVGVHVALPGDMPTTVVPIPGTSIVAVNSCGYHDPSLTLIDVNTREVVQKIALANDWIGMCFDPTRQTLFLSSGHNIAGKTPTPIQAFKWNGKQLEAVEGISLPIADADKRFVSGIATDGKGTLFVANIQTDMLYKLSGDKLSVVGSKQVPYRPYGVALSPDGQTLAVSSWGDQSVSLLNASDLSIRKTVPVGIHPNAVAYAPDGRLFVANAGSNSVSVLKQDKVVEQIRVSLDADPKLGATPVALAVDQDRLYVANADNNAVAVVNIAKEKATRVLGFVPTGRYPSALAVVQGKLLVGTAKGLSDTKNVDDKDVDQNSKVFSDADGKLGTQAPYTYIARLLKGHLSVIDLSSIKDLKPLTLQVRKNMPNTNRGQLSASQQKETLQALRKIKHVLYIVKENRTYDQVLGDVKAGNGDPRLTLFPERVTPNIHALARRHVLLDNLYCDGEVSQVGHQWTDAAYANDYTEKQWELSYSGRGEVDSDARMFTSPGGYIWENAKKHGKTARIYGEYLQWQEDHDSAHDEVKADPEKFGCSAEFEKVFARHGRDTEKADVFIKELKEFEKHDNLPNFMVMALNEDHTNGMSAGSYTPWSCVASNDLAVGRVVEALSKSKFWAETAIFIIQDDAQDGPDHVDAHRTVGQVISPYSVKGIVDSTMYTTCSMIRTMELILDLPPMSQYDAKATPMYGCFTTKPDLTPYTALPPQVDLSKKNPSKGKLAERSKKLDFSADDKADFQELNSILWEAIKPGVPMPAPVVGHR